MRTRRPLATFAVACGIGAAIGPSATDPRAQGLAPATYQSLNRAIVRVHASGCPVATGAMTGQRILNGFFFGSDATIITSRHGVAGCSSVGYCAAEAPSRCDARTALAAAIAKTIARADLALLRVTVPPTSLPKLAILKKTATTSVNERVFVLAHWMNAPSVTDKEVRIGNGSKTIREKFEDNNNQALEQLKALQSPSLDLAVLNVDGQIIDGASGAPVVNKDGDLVGIIDGGLSNGVAGINWAIPASEIPQLLASSEPLPSVAEGRLTSLHHAQEFAMTGVDAASNTTTCGGHQYLRVRTVSLREIAATTDDPLGLTQLITMTGMAARNPTFDVYAEAESSAVFVVPSGSPLGDAGQLCQATVRTSSTGSVTIRFDRRAVTSPVETQAVSALFESMAVGNRAWMLNPQWSYLAPSVRYDGAVFNRKSVSLLGPAPVAASPWSLAMPRIDGYLFETLAAKGGSVAMSVAAYTSSTVDLALIPPDCMQSPTSCPSAADVTAWTTAVAAVFLTTYPVN